jgi:hypothetical protein
MLAAKPAANNLVGRCGCALFALPIDPSGNVRNVPQSASADEMALRKVKRSIL